MTPTEEELTAGDQVALGLAMIRRVMQWLETPTGALNLDRLKKPAFAADMAALARDLYGEEFLRAFAQGREHVDDKARAKALLEAHANLGREFWRGVEAVKELALRYGRQEMSRERSGKWLSGILAALAWQVVLGQNTSEGCVQIAASMGSSARASSIDRALGDGRVSELARVSRVYGALTRGLEERVQHRADTRRGAARGELGKLLESMRPRVVAGEAKRKAAEGTGRSLRERDTTPSRDVTPRRAASVNDEQSLSPKTGGLPVKRTQRRRRRVARGSRSARRGE